MIEILYRLYDTHLGLGSDVDPLRKRTEVLLYFLDDGDILVPQDESNWADDFKTLTGSPSSASYRRIVVLWDLFGELKWS